MTELHYRLLNNTETELIREIDRRETGEEIYYFRNGRLELEKEHYALDGFDPEHIANIITRQKRLIEEGGFIIGAFDQDKLVGVASVENKTRGAKENYRKMDILYVSYGYRKRGIGRDLINECKKYGKQMGGTKLYISATPSKNTIHFYFHNGAILTQEIDKGLFDLEPEDIHLELEIE